MQLQDRATQEVGCSSTDPKSDVQVEQKKVESPRSDRDASEAEAALIQREESQAPTCTDRSRTRCDDSASAMKVQRGR